MYFLINISDNVVAQYQKDAFDNVPSDKFQFSFDIDIPQNQKPYFYKYLDEQIVPNDEQSIQSYQEDFVQTSMDERKLKLAKLMDASYKNPLVDNQKTYLLFKKYDSETDFWKYSGDLQILISALQAEIDNNDEFSLFLQSYIDEPPTITVFQAIQNYLS